MEKSRVSTAALYGIYLSIPSIVVMLINDSFNPGGAISILLWIVKFAGSIWILHRLIKEWASNFNEFNYGAGVSFGSLTCTFSSIIVALFSWLNVAVINKENYANKIDEAMSALEASMNSDQLEIVENAMNHIEEYVLFGSLIYCTIFGVIVTLIIANFTKKENMDFDSFTNNTAQ